MALQVTAVLLKQIAPTAPQNIDDFVVPLNEIVVTCELNTPVRLACFLAQAAHESEAFRFTKELGSGKEYEGRPDLGNTQPGDGMRYKGRGIFEITGKYNYVRCSEALFHDRNHLLGQPELLETPNYAVLSAGWFWQTRHLNSICDMPEDKTIMHNGIRYNMFTWLTYHINGGLNGLADRIAYYERAKVALMIN